MTREELKGQVLDYIKETPRTFVLIEKTFRVQAAPFCKPGRYGPQDIRPELYLGRILQELRMGGRIRHVNHAWRFVK